MVSVKQKYNLEMGKYEPKDYEMVRKLFSNGIMEHAVTAIADGLNGTKPRTQVWHFSIFVACLAFGLLYSSFLNGIYYFLIYEALHTSLVYYFFKAYVNAQLETDMKDKEMKFWTTSPNSFYVIRVGDDLNVKVLGIVAMQKRDETTVELNRLSVRPDVRGIGVGKKLVLTVIQEAKRLGFENVYLVTSDVQKDAMKLYEKLGFKKLGEIRINDGITAFIPESFHGVRRIEYLFQIPK